MPVDVEDFYRRYGPMVLRRCRAILHDEDKALDAMQDTFVQILRRREALENRAPSSLLYITATNVCLNVLRSERRKRVAADDSLLLMIASAENVEDDALNRMTIDEVFSDELESTRTIAVLHYFDKLSLEETALRMGMSVSGVRKRLRLLRKRSGIQAEEP